MTARSLTLLFLLYVSLDLSNPFMPGAFNFDPDESVDGVARHRENVTQRLVNVSTPVVPTPRPADVFRLPSTAVARPERAPCAVNDWLVDVRRAHAPVPEVSALTEDH